MVMAVALMLAAAATAPSRDPFNLDFARAMVGARLRDSGSAKFLEVRYVTNELICGSVNAKNGHGGYSGYVPFAVYAYPTVDNLDAISVSEHDHLFSEVLIGYDARMRDAVQALCRDN